MWTRRRSGPPSINFLKSHGLDLADLSAEHDQDIRRPRISDQTGIGPDAQRADEAGVVVVDQVLAAKAHGRRQVEAPGKRRDPIPRGRRPAHPAEQQQWRPGGGQQFGELGQRPGVRLGVGGLGRLRGEGGHGRQLDVFGQSNDDRPGPSGKGERNGFLHDPGDVLGPVRDEDPFCHPAIEGGKIDLLKRHAPFGAGGGMADQQDHRHAFLFGGMNADGRIAGAGSAGHHAHAGPSGQAGIGLGHIGGAPFLAADMEGEAVSRLANGVEYAEITLAGHAIGPVDAVGRQNVNNRLAAGPCLAAHAALREGPV